MKKILFSVMAVVLCLGLMGGAFAYFSDTETSSGNTFTAGTIDLEMNDENPRVSAIFAFPDIKPCEVLEPIVIKLENVGQNNGYLYQKITYIEKDKVEVPESDGGNLSADSFAALIYVKTITYQHVYSDGSLGSSRDDMAGLLAIDVAFGNSDGMCSLYEMMLAGWLPYDILGETDPDPEHTLKVGEAGTWTIVFHMADSLVSYPDGALELGVEDNWPQADGIELTWTAILRQNPGSVNPLP